MSQKGYLRLKKAEPLWYTGLGDVDNLGNALELLGNGHFFVAPGTVVQLCFCFFGPCQSCSNRGVRAERCLIESMSFCIIFWMKCFCKLVIKYVK